MNETTPALKALLDAGVLEPGATLWARVRGHRHDATVDENGRLHLSDGSIHESPSGAASATGRYLTNGWTFWRSGEDDEAVPLKELRERARRSGG